MKRIIAAVLPLLIILGGVIGATVLIKSRKVVQSITPAPVVRGVETVRVERGPITLDLESDGIVQPRTETTIVAEVTGRITRAEPVFETGAFVGDDQTMLTIDRSTYEAAVASADAELARAGASLTRESSEAQLAIEEWAKFGQGEPTPLAKREPQLAEANAMVKSAKARLARAEIDLQRTEIRSPFAGRIRMRYVDDGQYVTAGTPIATIYSTDFAELRVAVAPADLAFVDLPLGKVTTEPENALAATVRAEYGGVVHEWDGYVARTEGEVDRATRMIYAIIRIPDPYARVNGDGRHPPLLIGSFATATITGRRLEDAAEISRRALIERSNGTEREWLALVVDSEDRLRLRPVEVLRLRQRTAIIGSGLSAGERLCVSPLDIPVDGMRVRSVSDTTDTDPPVGAKGATP